MLSTMAKINRFKTCPFLSYALTNLAVIVFVMASPVECSFKGGSGKQGKFNNQNRYPINRFINPTLNQLSTSEFIENGIKNLF